MATRSRIAIENTDGTVKSVYCHWDGYPSNNGALLLENYNDETKIRELISMGEISSLDENIKPKDPSKHNFDNRESGTTCFYHRDRGEDLTIDEHHSIKDWQKKSCRQAWNYIWRNGKWYFQNSTAKNLVVLKPSHCVDND